MFPPVKVRSSPCSLRTSCVLSHLLQTHKCVAVFEGHSSKVSCLLVSAAPSLHHRLYSGSSDQTIRCYSLKVRPPHCSVILFAVLCEACGDQQISGDLW